MSSMQWRKSLSKKIESLLQDLENRIEYFNQIGSGFIRRENAMNLQDESAEKDLRQRILKCRRCSLSETRTRAVPGEGNFQADLLFVGEGPGRDEDVQGRPFVGRAGKLLTKIIAAMHFIREEVYITNVVKCRPPQNRNPRDEEIEACKDYLLEQIERIQPQVIVTLGKVATDFFVPGPGSMGSKRGKFQLFHDIPVMPTYHPSYLVRNEGNRELKKKVWDDMQQVMVLLAKK